jgi:hypothetical protein
MTFTKHSSQDYKTRAIFKFNEAFYTNQVSINLNECKSYKMCSLNIKELNLISIMKEKFERFLNIWKETI